MTMETLVLQRLIDEVRAPIPKLLSEAESLRTQLFNANRDRDRISKDYHALQKCQLPFTDLHRAADELLKAKTPVRRRAARLSLEKALKAANEHIDWIPF